MDRQMIVTRLAALPGEIEEAEWALLEGQARLAAARDHLADREAELFLASNVIDGKNAELRAAQLRGFTVAERQAVGECETLVGKRKATFGRLINEFRAVLAAAQLLSTAAEMEVA